MCETRGLEMTNLPSKRAKNAISTVQGISEMVTRWHDDLAQRVAMGEMAETTAATYRRGLARFMTWAETDADGKTGAQAIRSWLASLKTAGYRANSIQSWYGGLRAFYAWGIGQDVLAQDPTKGIKGARRKGTKRQHLRDALTDTEMNRVLGQYKDGTLEGLRNRAILHILAYCAVRTIEVVRADRADVRTEGGHLAIYLQGKGQTETSGDKAVLEHPDAEAALYDWLAVRGNGDGALFHSLSDRNRGQRLTTRSVRLIVKDALRRAGIDDRRKTAHSFRHSAASAILRHGGTVQDVKTLLRHENIDTSMIYVHELDRTANPPERFIKYDGSGK